jgi:cytosine permease
MADKHSGPTALASEMEGVEAQVDHILGAEYEHEAVPAAARRSMFSVIMVWIGFPMIITGAMTGSILVIGMGFSRALEAMIIGNLIMFLYVGALGTLGTRLGFNFALLASIVFGRKGYVFASALLATLLLGWYAVQVGITGALINTAYELGYIWMTILAGVLYMGITFVGVRGLHWIGVVSVPLFVVLGVWVAADAASTTTWDAIMGYPGANPAIPMSMGVGLTIVITLFIDAGTVTADFNRWAKDTPSSLAATFSAFPFANLAAMLVGGVMTAALAVPDANPFGKDNMFGYMIGQGSTWLAVLAFVFLLCNLGSVCSHCLYNAATGWSRVVGSHMRLLAVILAGVGIAVAATNVWAFFIEWLTLLGILVPPIGAIILTDQYVFRRNARIGADWRIEAFIAWIAGSVVAFVVEKAAPEYSTAISAAIAAAIVYSAIMVARGAKPVSADTTVP